VLTDGQGNCVAVDFTGKCGAPLLVAASGPQIGGKARNKGGVDVSTVTTDAGNITIMTMGPGALPKAKAEGNAAVIGSRTIAFDGKVITLK
jgi:hypothetical protein